MKKQNIIIANADDWEALYIDGKCVTQGHEVTAKEALTLLGFQVERKEVSCEWLEENSYFPDKVEDVKFID